MPCIYCEAGVPIEPTGMKAILKSKGFEYQPIPQDPELWIRAPFEDIK